MARAVLVAGAASGIGQATAIALAASGASVAVGTFAGDAHDAQDAVGIIRAADSGRRRDRRSG